MNRPLALAVTLVVAASIFQGLIGVFVKWIPWPPLALACSRCVVAGAVLWVTWLARGGKWASLKLTARARGMLVLSGGFLAAHWAALFYGYRLSNVGPVIVAVFTFPVVASLVEPFLFGERPSLRDLGWAIVGVLGVGTIAWEGLAADSEANLLVGVGFGLLASVFFAARGIASRKLLAASDPIFIMAIQVSVVAIVFSPALLSIPAEALSGRELGLVLFLGVGLTAVPHTVFVWAFQSLSVARSGVIASLEVVSGILFATLLLGERNPLTVWLGAAVVIVAVIAQSRASLKAPSEVAAPSE